MREYNIIMKLYVVYFVILTPGVRTELSSSNTTDNMQEFDASKQQVNESLDGNNTENVQEFDTSKQQVNESLDGHHQISVREKLKDDIKNFDNMINSQTETVPNVYTKPHEHIKPQESCRNTCGTAHGNLSCSCDLKCLVYNNCCEDMSTACPEVLQESRVRYGHMLDMKVECTSSNYFVITSCGNGRTTTAQRLDNNPHALNTKSTITLLSAFLTDNIRKDLSKSITTTSQLPTKQPVKDIHDITDIINNIYVTDTATGFIYKNMEIFSCAAGEMSSPVKWTVQFETDLIIESPSIDQILQRITEFRYAPPTYLISASMSSRCVYTSIGTCKESIINENIDLLYKCQQFISYVIFDTLSYNNKYCQICNNNVTRKFTGFGIIHGSTFSLTMTVSATSLIIRPGGTLSIYARWKIATFEVSESDSTALSSTTESDSTALSSTTESDSTALSSTTESDSTALSSTTELVETTTPANLALSHWMTVNVSTYKLLYSLFVTMINH